MLWFASVGRLRHALLGNGDGCWRWRQRSDTLCYPGSRDVHVPRGSARCHQLAGVDRPRTVRRFPVSGRRRGLGNPVTDRLQVLGSFQFRYLDVSWYSVSSRGASLSTTVLARQPSSLRSFVLIRIWMVSSSPNLNIPFQSIELRYGPWWHILGTPFPVLPLPSQTRCSGSYWSRWQCSCFILSHDDSRLIQVTEFERTVPVPGTSLRIPIPILVLRFQLLYCTLDHSTPTLLGPPSRTGSALVVIGPPSRTGSALVVIGPSSRTGSALVVIHVDDVNDERPRFTQKVYAFRVWENELPGTNVIFRFLSSVQT